MEFTIPESNLPENADIVVTIGNGGYKGTNNSLINDPEFSAVPAQVTYTEVSRKTITLSAENDWKQVFLVGGSGLVANAQFDNSTVPPTITVPATTTDGKTSYYSILEGTYAGNTFTSTVPDGYTSVVSDTHVTDEGTLLATNTANWQTTKLRIRKVRNDGLTPLADAVFQLSWKEDEQGVYQVSALDGVEGLETVTIGGVTYDNTFTSTEMTWYLNGLRDGYYKLKEIHIPAGFTNTIGDVFFEIHNGVVSCPTAEQTDKVEFQMAGVAAAEALMTITNDVGGGIVLPATGGPGTAVFYAFGAALVLLAFAMIMRRHHPDF